MSGSPNAGTPPGRAPSTSSRRLGPYEVLEHLGEGGMCHVFRARRDGADEDVALKVVKPELEDDERVQDLFTTEADISLLLKHNNLIRAIDAGEHQGRLFLALELLRGGSLDQLIAFHRLQGMSIHVHTALFIVSEVANGLEALHNATGMSGRPLHPVHRDVTPHNIMFTKQGRVVLGDFGGVFLQLYGEEGPDEGIPGKLDYLPPELLKGETLDQRADIYSLGVVTYELLTGERPFAAPDDEQTIQAIVSGEARPLYELRPSIPEELDRVVRYAIAPEPTERFDTAADFRSALARFWSPQKGNAKRLVRLMNDVGLL